MLCREEGDDERVQRYLTPGIGGENESVFGEEEVVGVRAIGDVEFLIFFNGMGSGNFVAGRT